MDLREVFAYIERNGGRHYALKSRKEERESGRKEKHPVIAIGFASNSK